MYLVNIKSQTQNAYHNASIYMTLWKKQNYRDEDGFLGFQVGVRVAGGLDYKETASENFGGDETSVSGSW